MDAVAAGEISHFTCLLFPT